MAPCGGSYFLNVPLSRYLSHALVLIVTVAVVAYVAPAAISAHRATPSGASYDAVLADSQSGLPVRLELAAAGCAAPPAISTNASLSRLIDLQRQVQNALNGCAARVEGLNKLRASLDRQITAGTQRIASEQLLLAGLARILYRQPRSVLVTLTTSRNLGDFFTQYADMQAAGARAQQLTAQLQTERTRLQTERAEVAAAQTEEATARAALQAASNRLQQLQDALLAELNAGAQPPVGFTIPPGPRAIIQDIEDAFNPLGQNAVYWALRVAKCESGYNPNAVNPWSGTEGLFQFEPSTWRETPYGHDNVFDPKYNSLAAAWLYQRDGPSQWQCS